MKKGWDIPLTLGGLLALLLWLKPQVAAQTAAAAAITLSGAPLLVAVVGVAFFGWWVLKHEGKQNGCVGPVLMLAGAAALIAFTVAYGG